MLKTILISLVVATTLALSSAPDVLSAAYAPQTSDEQGIKATATLQAVSGKSKIWTVEVTMETHTRSLVDDMSKAAVLVVDGKAYAPVDWEGSPPGGHHRKGLLRFKSIEPQPVQLELQLRLSVDAAPRSFRWRLR